MFLGAANRDPRRWADPETFELDRDPSGQVGFGIHQCTGQHLARMEAEVLVTEAARRVRTTDMVGPGESRLNDTLRAWASLPCGSRRPAGRDARRRERGADLGMCGAAGSVPG
jgi:cytochrome P450